MTIEHANAKAKRPRGPPPIVRDFYGSALGAAHQTAMKYAANIEGLDEEIKVLRTRLRDAVGESPESFQLMVRGMELLARLVAVRHRLSRKAEKQISDSLSNLVRGLASELYPEAPDVP